MKVFYLILILIFSIAGIVLFVNYLKLAEISDTPLLINGSQTDTCPNGTIKNEGICKPKIMNLMAPDDLIFYTQKVVAHSRIYALNDSILVEKAQELTKGIDNDYEKVRVIANWVHHSKNYADCNNCDSLSAAFESATGVCNEAALITVAMLRAVNIPSIPVGAPAHAFTAFNIDNRWQGVDSTFCPDKNNCGNIIISPNTLLDSQGNEINSVFYTVDNLGSVEQESGKFCDSFGYCVDSSFRTTRLILQRNDLPTGELIVPALRRTSTISDGQISCSLKPKNFRCDITNGCYAFTGNDSWDATDSIYSDKEQWFEVGMEIGGPSIGYLSLALPENEYIYRCTFQNGADIKSRRIVAFKEFYLSSGSKTIITYKDLSIGNGTEEEFSKLKDELRNATEDLGIYP